MKTIPSRNLSLGDVHQLFNYQKQRNDSFTSFLSLETLTEFEIQEVAQIREDFDRYFTDGIVSEGQIKFLTVAPLLRLAGFYKYPIKITLEENIAELIIEDEETKITGRIDILAVNYTHKINNDVPFWVLVLETKNSEIAPSAGLPQLLSYAFNSLKYQSIVWGLVTNGEYYQFVRIQSEKSPIYQLLPSLNFLETEPSQTTLQVLKAIRHFLL